MYESHLGRQLRAIENHGQSSVDGERRDHEQHDAEAEQDLAADSASVDLNQVKQPDSLSPHQEAEGEQTSEIDKRP